MADRTTWILSGSLGKLGQIVDVVLHLAGGEDLQETQHAPLEFAKRDLL
jgi:hypothetical protein